MISDALVWKTGKIGLQSIANSILDASDSGSWVSEIVQVAATTLRGTNGRQLAQGSLQIGLLTAIDTELLSRELFASDLSLLPSSPSSFNFSLLTSKYPTCPHNLIRQNQTTDKQFNSSTSSLHISCRKTS
jgi:hypothetical protein